MDDSCRSWAVLAIVTAALSAGLASASEWPDERALRLAKVEPRPMSVLRCLRDRCGSERDLLDLPRLIEQLGSSRFAEREQAEKKLVALGEAALPALGSVLGDRDLERARRAARCVRSIGRYPDTAVSIAAVRWLARKKVDGAAAVLLRYLPFAPTQAEREEVWYALDALASTKGADLAPHAAALRDPVPLRRAAAGYVLARRGTASRRKAARALLRDSHPEVRLRVAQGLLGAGDGSVVPTLMALLDDAPVPVAWQAEELLRWASGGKGPREVIGAGSPPARRAARQAWQAWWKRQPAPPNIARLAAGPARPGLVLVGERSRLWLCGCDAVPRWKLELKGTLRDASLDGERLLLAEQSGRFPDGGISERDLKGAEVRALVPAEGARACWRLAVGDLGIGSQFCTAVYNHANQKIVLRNITATVSFSAGTALSPRMGPHGLLVVHVVLRGGQLGIAELEPNTWAMVRYVVVQHKEQCSDKNIQPLPGGGYLLARFGGKRAIEVDGTGKVVWESPPLGINDARRLPGGATLIAATWRVAAVNPAGKVFWEVITDGQVDRLWPCLGVVRLGFDAPPPGDLDLDASVAHRLNGLRDPRPVVRCRSAAALARLGAKAAEAVPLLLDMLDDPDSLVRKVARDSLSHVVTVSKMKRLSRAVREDRRAHVRRDAAWVLGDLPQASQDSLAALRRALGDDSFAVQEEAARALGRLGKRARDAVPDLVAVLARTGTKSSDEAVVKHTAALALARIGPAAKAAVPALIRALDGKDDVLRRLSAVALGEIGSAAKPSVPRLVRILADPTANRFTRRNAAEALGRIGVRDAGVLQTLREAAEDKDEQIKREAKASLQRLQPAKSAE